MCFSCITLPALISTLVLRKTRVDTGWKATVTATTTARRARRNMVRGSNERSFSGFWLAVQVRWINNLSLCCCCAHSPLLLSVCPAAAAGELTAAWRQQHTAPRYCCLLYQSEARYLLLRHSYYCISRIQPKDNNFKDEIPPTFDFVLNYNPAC